MDNYDGRGGGEGGWGAGENETDQLRPVSVLVYLAYLTFIGYQISSSVIPGFSMRPMGPQ